MSTADKLDHLLRGLLDQLIDQNTSLDVDVVVTTVKKKDSKSIVEQIKSVGGNVSKFSKEKVQAQLPADKVLELAAQDGVSKIRMQRKHRIHG